MVLPHMDPLTALFQAGSGNLGNPRMRGFSKGLTEVLHTVHYNTPRRSPAALSPSHSWVG